MSTTRPEFPELPTTAHYFSELPTIYPQFLLPHLPARRAGRFRGRVAAGVDPVLVFLVGEIGAGMSTLRLAGGGRVAVQHTRTERITSFVKTISAVGKNQRWHFDAIPAATIDLSTVSRP